jgi:hypothetical protein
MSTPMILITLCFMYLVFVCWLAVKKVTPPNVAFLGFGSSFSLLFSFSSDER